MAHPDRFLLAGLMGWPVMHSRSPKLHNYWLSQHGLAGTYLPLAIKADGLRVALRALPALGFAGCNLTIPHKVAALDMVDRVDPLARRIGAMNCVVVAPDGSLEGQNHDAFGYIESIREAQPGWRADAGPIVVIGAGGGARAVLVSLVDQGAREIRLVNRTPARAQSLERELGGPIRAVAWKDSEAALEDPVMTQVEKVMHGARSPASRARPSRIRRGRREISRRTARQADQHLSHAAQRATSGGELVQPLQHSSMEDQPGRPAARGRDHPHGPSHRRAIRAASACPLFGRRRRALARGMRCTRGL